MKRAAIYLRVSTEEQTTENQRRELLRIARARGFKVLKRHVFDETGSAAKERPKFDAMTAAARRGDFQALIVWAIDRFGRSMVGNLDAVLKFDTWGVSIISARESWLDTTGPTRSLLVAVFSWVAEQERCRLVERTKAGMERARRQGIHVGRPLAHVNMTIVRAMLEGGATQGAIAKQLGVSDASVSRALARMRLQKGVSREGGGNPSEPDGAPSPPNKGPLST